MSALARSVARNAIGLGFFAVVTAGLIAITQQLTADDIQEQRERAQAGALLEVIPEGHHDSNILNDRFTIEASEALGLTANATGYRARQDGRIVGVILPTMAPDGYTGPIRLIVGIDRDGKLLGARVLEHKETPGLGDQIEVRKSDWINGFTGKSLGDPAPEQWQVEKRGGAFDQFTGATITPDAVVTAVRGALEYFVAHRPLLLSDRAVIPAETAGRSPDNG
jgi:electron transport complex protein RnfG